MTDDQFDALRNGQLVILTKLIQLAAAPDIVAAEDRAREALGLAFDSKVAETSDDTRARQLTDLSRLESEWEEDPARFGDG